MTEAKMTKEEKERELKWQTERDFDTLMEYQKLIKDPERLKRAKKLASEKKKELSAILSGTKGEE